jgi:hypothetical protein
MSAGTVGIVVACLPDLESTRVPSVTDAAALCGDERIELGEQCDPGQPDTSVPGCTRDCKIDCDAGGLPAFVDNASNHCYFMLSKDAGSAEAASEGCKTLGAHVITLGSSDEQSAVTEGLTPYPATSRFWLGLVPTDPQPPDAAALTYSSVVDEPGLATPGDCRGCFTPPNARALFARSIENDASGECVAWRLNSPEWENVSCDSALPTICEREPIGSRASSCNGAICFDIQLTSKNKEYIFPLFPVGVDASTDASGGSRMSAEVAAETCAALGKSGQEASLVIFAGTGSGQTAFEEREQIFYELLQFPSVMNVSAPKDFWIGLASSAVDGGAVVWTWADGRPDYAYPLPWGDREPKATLPQLLAYAEQTGTAGYGYRGKTYDTQLAHARNPSVLDAGVDASFDAGDAFVDAAADVVDAEGGSDAEASAPIMVELHATLCQRSK